MEPMLTVNEVAQLKGCKPQYIRKLAKEGTLQADMTMTERKTPLYMIPLTALEPTLQERYFREKQRALAATTSTAKEPSKAAKPLESYTAEEREEIGFWTELVSEWQGYRKRPGANATAVDEEFISLCRLRYPERAISTDILYRRWKALREGELDGLLDRRGKWKKGRSTIEEPVWQAFLSYYLDESQHPIKKCWEYTKLWAQAERPELAADIPSYTTFYRHIQADIPEAVEMLGRKGEKAFRDRCAPYIRRVYDQMESNEWWIADNHTFDIISQDGNGQRHRLYLTAFFDARSGIFTGCHVTNAPCSQATLIALRKGILKYGIPENIYVDNGREFLTFDIGGLGHRKKKPKNGQERFEPPPVFARLGIKMTNAIVRNAKAKIIERRFRDVKDHLSRLFDTYVGGNVVEKPERLKHVLKAGDIPLDANLVETVETLLDWYFNQQPYGGQVAEDRGKPRMQVYNENLLHKRVAGAEELNLMLMRSTRPQQVTRRGVHLDIAGERIDYWNEDVLMNLLGQRVYLRYDPEDLSEVRIYDLEDRFLMTAPADNVAVLTYGSSKEDVKEAMGKVRRMEKVTKEALKYSAFPAIGKRTALELVMAQAQEAKEAKMIPDPDPKILTIQRAEEEPLLKAAVGAPDLGTMVKNAAQKRGGSHDEKL